MSKGAIIRDASVFAETFIPDTLTGRRQQAKEITRHLRSALNGDYTCLYVYGHNGTGKTMTLRHVLKKHFDRRSIYINCADTITSHRTLEEILKKRGSIIHGWESSDDLIDKFKTMAQKRDLIVCLDEIDELKDSRVIGWIRDHCGLVLVSNGEYSRRTVGSKTFQKLSPYRIVFDSYSKDETTDILRQRIADGLEEEFIDEKNLDLICTMSDGDARIALQTLEMSAKCAEQNNSETISISEIRHGLRCTGKRSVSDLLYKLNPYQKIIYDIIKEYGEVQSSSLYEKYQKTISSGGMSGRTRRSYGNDISGMRELGIVRQLHTGRHTRYEFVV